MNTDTLYEAIGSIDDSIIQQTNYILQYRQKNRTLKWISAAACFVAIFLGAIGLFRSQVNQVYTDLPILTIGDDISAYGSEGEFAFTISELENANPWNDSITIETLPVYKNQVKRDGAGVPQTGLTVDEMEARIRETAKALDITIGEVTVYPTKEDVEDLISSGLDMEDSQIPYEAQAVGEGVTIKAEADNSVSILFDTPIVLPDEYSFTRQNTSYEQGIETLSYLIDEFKELLSFESPAIDFSDDYNIYAEHSLSYRVYEKKGSIVEQMVNYRFNCAYFYPNENGELDLIRLYKTDLSEKIGDYPLISSSKALKLLLQGKYITSSGYEMPGKEYVSKVELVYRGSPWEEYFMPYYRFYVELPEEQRDNGLKAFGMYYVSAIKENYLSTSP